MTAKEQDARFKSIMAARELVAKELDDLIIWCDERKIAETYYRPDTNIHRRTLVETWDQVRRKLVDRRMELRG